MPDVLRQVMSQCQCENVKKETTTKVIADFLFWQLVAQGQFTVLKQPLGFIKILQWVSLLFYIFIGD